MYWKTDVGDLCSVATLLNKGMFWVQSNLENDSVKVKQICFYFKLFVIIFKYIIFIFIEDFFGCFFIFKKKTRILLQKKFAKMKSFLRTKTVNFVKSKRLSMCLSVVNRWTDMVLLYSEGFYRPGACIRRTINNLVKPKLNNLIIS